MEDSFYIDTLAENSRLEEKVKYLKEREAEKNIVFLKCLFGYFWVEFFASNHGQLIN